MLDSYLPTLSLTVLYLLLIRLGNRCMRSRPALSLRGVLTLYNLGITLLSAYMLAEVSVRKTVTLGIPELSTVSINTDLKYLKKLFQRLILFLPNGWKSLFLT